MKKGLLSALCLVVLLAVPACCWKKPCSPSGQKDCGPKLCDKPNACVEEKCDTVIEQVPAQRKVHYITRVEKRCDPAIIQPCCDENEDLMQKACAVDADAETQSVKKMRRSR